jgi:hypothetical protein
MEQQRIKKPTLSLRKTPPVTNPAPTPIVEANSPQEYPDFNVERYTDDSSPVDWLEVDEYYSQRKKPRGNKRTHRNAQTRNESRWQ